MRSVPIVVHVGYPKTATTTFQVHVFPNHPEIDYLGKFIPSHDYRGQGVYDQIDALLHRSALHPPDLTFLQRYLEAARQQSNRKVVLVSSEAFVHPTVIDIAMVAERLKEAVGDGRILITIREQIGAILSFYWMHGRHGQFLSFGARDSSKRSAFPLSFSEWIEAQLIVPDKNYLATLRYDEVLDCYVKFFGKENISVLLFETLLRTPDAYARQLGGILGVDTQIINDLMAGSHENASGNSENQWGIDDVGKKQKDSFLVRHWRRNNERKLSASEIGQISDLREYYKLGNRRLISEYAMQVDNFGYAL